MLLLLSFDVVLTLRIKRFKGERRQKAIGDQLICKFYANLSLYLYIVPVTTLIFFTDSCGFFSLSHSLFAIDLCRDAQVLFGLSLSLPLSFCRFPTITANFVCVLCLCYFFVALYLLSSASFCENANSLK